MKSIDLNISLEQFLIDCPECRWLMEELGIAPEEHGSAFARLERRIHEQIYMENHVLYPRSLAIRGAP